MREAWDARARRARFLAGLYPVSREVLMFYAAVAEWQGRQESDASIVSLLDLVIREGPPLLAAAARRGECLPADFFGRVVGQVKAAALPSGFDCDWCSRPPLTGCLVLQGEGLALELVCGLCFRRRPFPRLRCPGCGETREEKLEWFTTGDFPHLRLHACASCKGSLLVVDLSRDPAAIPEVDELIGMPLDFWAIGQGYHRLQPNFAGI